MPGSLDEKTGPTPLRSKRILDRTNRQCLIVEPEYWVMRPIVCLYCNTAAQWDLTGRGKDTMDHFHEEMGIDSHVHGWVYCTDCAETHRTNRRRYLDRHGYIAADELFRDHPQLHRLDRKRQVNIRVAHPSEHCTVYTVEKKGWEIAKTYPYKFCCFLRHGKVWIRLVNAEIGSYACCELVEVLKTNRIEVAFTGAMRDASIRALHQHVSNPTSQIIMHFAFGNRVDQYPLQVQV